MVRLAFAKYEGLGNDFLVVDGSAPAVASLTPARVAGLCDRHLGVGADGVLLTGLEGGRPFMRVHNADGSIPQMCGNGLRCAVLHLVRVGAVHGEHVTVDTDAGPHPCKVKASGPTGTVAVAMRAASFAPSSVPVVAHTPLVDHPVAAGDGTVRITALSIGNPHAVTFDDVGDRRLSLGPALAQSAAFPEGVNVGFARLARAGGLDLHVFERGAGWTRACGTGACAAAAAAVETGRAPRGEPIPVRLPGGTLVITVGAEGEPILMDGPARHVFDGEVDLEVFPS
jgi:diaminopimelate epimerase